MDFLLREIFQILYEFNYKILITSFICIILLSIIISIINFILSQSFFLFLLSIKKYKNTEELSKLKNTYNFFRFILFLCVVSSFILYIFFDKSEFFPFLISNYKLFLILCTVKSLLVIIYMYWTIHWAELRILEEELKEKEKAKMERLKYLEEQEKSRVEKRIRKKF